MKLTLSSVAGRGLLGALASLTLAAPSAGQPPQGSEPAPGTVFPGTGTELFRGLFNYHGIAPLQSAGAVTPATAANTIVIVLIRREDGVMDGRLSSGTTAATATALRNG